MPGAGGTTGFREPIERLPGAAPPVPSSFLPPPPVARRVPEPAAPYSLEADARATFAADDTAQPRRPSAAWWANARTNALMFAVFLMPMAYALLAGTVCPFRFWDAVVLICIALLPAEGAALFFFAEDHPLAARNLGWRLRSGGMRTLVQVLPGFAIIGLFLPAALVLEANQLFDKSVGQQEELQVRRVWSESRKHGTAYFAGVEPAGRAPLRFGSFYEDQPVQVSERRFAQLQPGRSSLTLAVHPGALGLPWYRLMPQGNGN